MKVDRIFINCYRYDFHLAKICVASVRYWYPDIPIYLIKDEGRGKFNTRRMQEKWNVKVLALSRKSFGWGYGKLETLFLEPSFSFLVLDADTVLTGPVLDKVENIDADFIVDDEVQPSSRFNEIYYNLNTINQIDSDFVYPGYSFNTGQWFGTTGKITRQDFDATLKWTEPPQCKFPRIVFKGDQAHLNFVVHKMEQQGRIRVKRIKLMVWPTEYSADFINLDDIQQKSPKFPLIIHWAGMGIVLSKLNRTDILRFYRNYYSSRNGALNNLTDVMRYYFLRFERKIMYKLAPR